MSNRRQRLDRLEQTLPAIKMPWHTQLIAFDACSEAVEWATPFKTFVDAWQACERGDWLLWYVGKTTDDRHRLVLAACQCARLSLSYVPINETRPRLAIETAEQWARGESATLAEVRKAAASAASASSAAPVAYTAAVSAAYAAASTVAASAAAAASVAYTAAASTAFAAADAAAYTAAAYTAAAYTDADYATNVARRATLKQCANLVRAAYPEIGLSKETS